MRIVFKEAARKDYVVCAKRIESVKMKAFLAVLVLLLCVQAVNACQWAERVDVIVISSNSYPIEGAIASVTYQKYNAGRIDTNETKATNENGVATFNLCDYAPEYNLTYEYNVSAIDRKTGVSYLRREVYASNRSGVNRVYFIYNYSLNNVTVKLKDWTGAPIPDAFVSASGPYVSKNKTTNASGEAWFVTYNGPVYIYAEVDGTPLTAVVGDPQWNTVVNLSTAPPHINAITVNVHDDNATPVMNAAVTLDVNGSITHTTTDSAGVARITTPFDVVNLTVTVNRKTIYSHELRLSQNETVITVSIDLHRPYVSATTFTAENVGTLEREAYRLAFTCTANDTATPSSRLGVVLHYSVNEGVWVAVPMQNLGGDTFNARVDLPNIRTPFTIYYYAEATDEAGNAKNGSITSTAVEYILPVTPTPIPTPTPTRTFISDLPEPLRGMLTPFESNVITLMESFWIIIALIAVLLIGTGFVFVAVNAFFYVKKSTKPKPPKKEDNNNSD